MAESYRGFLLNQTGDPQWGANENKLHKDLIDKMLDNPFDVFANTIYVSPAGDDATGTGAISHPYKSISHAISQITDNSTENPYALQLAAGIYTESDTVTLGAGIFINGAGDASKIRTTNNNVPLFAMGDQSDISKVTIEGPSNAPATSITGAGDIVSFKNIKFNNCYNPIYVNGTGATVNIYSVAFRGSATLDAAIKIEAGLANVYTANATGMTGTNYFNVSGSASVLTVGTLTIFDTTVTNPIRVENGATFILTAAVVTGGTDGIYINGANSRVILANTMFQYSDIGIHIGPDGPLDVSLASVTFENTTTYDFYSETSNMRLTGQGNYISTDKFKYEIGVPTNGYHITYLSEAEGDESAIFKSELGVGAPDRPSESSFGEGDSYTRGMLVYQYDPTNGYNDITQLASSYSGSTFGWSDVVTDSALYACSTLKTTSDFVKYLGFKVRIATAGVLGTGGVITEYWNGTAWTPFTIMRTDGNAPYLPRVTPLIDAEPGSYQIRHNAFVDTDWAKNDPVGLGIDYFWTRVRITSDITTSPLFEQFKLHSNRMEINGDGWPEYFGKARPIGRLAWNYGMLEAAASSPGNQDHYLSDTLDVGKIENAFANNTIDRIGMLAPVPFDLDISTPIKFRWASRYGGNTGNVDWIIRWGYSKEGDFVYTNQADAPTTHATQQSIAHTVTVPATAQTVQWNTVELSVSNANPRYSDGTSDILWVSIERNGSTDTYAGTAGLIAISADYLKWTEGGHL